MEGYTMTTRHILPIQIAMVVGLLALAARQGAALPDVDGLDPLPVQGEVLPAGTFDGTLRLVACTLDAAGQLRVTGVLDGIASQRARGIIPVTQQPFTALATLRDPGRTTDVVLLALAPITLAPDGFQIKLSPITVEIETLPQVGDELASQLPAP
jgi:hypothetical protein